MRYFSLFYLTLFGTVSAGESAYPLWDGSESVAEYAKKVGLPPTKTLDLGNSVNLELVLIPAGKFTMGTPEPTPVDEHGFHKKIITGQMLLAVSSGILVVLLAFIIVKAIRKRQRPKYSLLWLLAITVLAGGSVLSGLHWQQSVQGLEKARAEYPAAKVRYDVAEKSEKPAHSVTLTKPFYMGKFTVTQEQYQQVIGRNPSDFIGKDNPVERVSWDDTHHFCDKLTEKTKQIVRLPTEAEWEYSCRAGTTTMYYSGDTEADLARVAWYDENSNNTTHAVGKKDSNAFGLYDMHGNVWQWCQDWWYEKYYTETPVENPVGPQSDAFREFVHGLDGGERVFRGGSWLNEAKDCRSAYRFKKGGSLRVSADFIGFRVVAEPAQKTP